MEKSRTRTLVYCEVSKISSGIYENKKSGILTHNEMDSALVGLSVLSSNFFDPNLKFLNK
jgi:hypothetical protein